MFQETKFQEVLVRIKSRDLEEEFQMQVAINENEDVYTVDLVREIRESIQIDEHALLFFSDSSKNLFSSLHDEENAYVPYSAITCEGIISIKVQSKMSDELLANWQPKREQVKPKRSPQRHIMEVFEIVENWRLMYSKGIINEKGEIEKVTLQRSALLSGVPRKSLQDYYLLIRNGYSLGFDFKINCRKKVGILRNYVKQKKKLKHEQVSQKQKNDPKFQEMVLTEVRKEMFGMSEKQYEQQLFRVVSSMHSSDEDEVNDMIFEN